MVQQIFDLGDGTSVKLTIAEVFLRPTGEALTAKALLPMWKWNMKRTRIIPEADNQLEKALEVMKEEQ